MNITHSVMIVCSTGDRWRVVLKGDVDDYIHAVVVHVSYMYPCLDKMFPACVH